MDEICGGIIGLVAIIFFAGLALYFFGGGLQYTERKLIDEPTDRKARAEARRIYCTNPAYYQTQQQIMVAVNGREWYVQVEDII